MRLHISGLKKPFCAVFAKQAKSLEEIKCFNVVFGIQRFSADGITKERLNPWMLHHVKKIKEMDGITADDHVFIPVEVALENVFVMDEVALENV